MSAASPRGAEEALPAEVRQTSDTVTVDIAQPADPDPDIGHLGCRERETVRPGELLEGKFRIEHRLGQGGMATVFLAEDITLGRKVAVKFLADFLHANAEFIARFEREARLTAQLEHPNIVTIYGAGRHGTRLFIVMKYIEGMPLSRYRRAQPSPLSLAEVRSIMRQLCAGLGYIHTKGFVHRDIKPSNIFIGPEGQVTVLDFGIVLDSRTDSLTRTGVCLGTPVYMSPEQVLGDGPVDHRSDLYSVGVVLYELLAGAPPFEGPSDFAVGQQHVTLPPPDLRAQAPWVPEAVSNVVGRALAKSPGDRFQSAGDLMDALDAACATVPHASPSGQATPPVRRTAHRTLAVGVIAACACLAVGASLTLGQRREKATLPSDARTNAPSEPVDSATPSAEIPEEGIAPSAEPGSRAQAPRRKAGQRAPSSTVAPSALGRLQVVTVERGEPTWATLSVDGVRRGGTPMSIELPVGRHHVSLTRAGYKGVERDVRITAGQPLVLRVELVR